MKIVDPYNTMGSAKGSPARAPKKNPAKMSDSEVKKAAAAAKGDVDRQLAYYRKVQKETGGRSVSRVRQDVYRELTARNSAYLALKAEADRR